MKYRTHILTILIAAVTLLGGCIGNHGSIEYCEKKDTGDRMSLTMARAIAQNSACINEGPLKDAHSCDTETGEWQIELDIRKPKCKPLCRINIESKSARINWNCEESIDPAEEYCFLNSRDIYMSLTEARKIAQASECVDSGPLEDTYFCNQETGTWWIDLDIPRPGCDPACLIDIEDKRARITWRCSTSAT